MFKLRANTPNEWATHVANNMDAFLVDHAAAERKASANAMGMVVRYPDRLELVDKMIAIAREELEHFHDVFRLMVKRGVALAADEADPYVNALLKACRPTGNERCIDRLLLGSIIEYRGCERFAMLSRALAEHPTESGLSDYYRELAASESQHRMDFYECALLYFPNDEVNARLDELLDLEATIVNSLPIRAALH
ncbi:MAG: tRNA-(ms[2]io[6]A)-hydroxylase [Bradymonadaceae bacterium]|nr:tRNA-(ms[2]io[6]A)-hydroxylase [Lujinxingiaceae bacterium]